MSSTNHLPIKAIIGLGNPGSKYVYHRHNIGFRVLDELAKKFGGSWQSRENMEYATIGIGSVDMLLIKPQTFMNDSGKVVPFLIKKGIFAENILVVHDELEMPFGKLKIRQGGSARGHNGLRSIIGVCGADFPRLCFGVDRPEQKEMVSQYVLTGFTEPAEELNAAIDKAVDMIVAVVEK